MIEAKAEAQGIEENQYFCTLASLFDNATHLLPSTPHEGCH